MPNIETYVPEHIENRFAQLRGELGVLATLAQEHNVNVRVRGEFTPPVSTKRDDGETRAAGDPAVSEFFFDRRAGDPFNQQVDNQTSRPNYLLSAYSEPVAQAQSLCLYFQEFF